ELAFETKRHEGSGNDDSSIVRPALCVGKVCPHQGRGTHFNQRSGKERWRSKGGPPAGSAETRRNRFWRCENAPIRASHSEMKASWKPSPNNLVGIGNAAVHLSRSKQR